MTRPRLQLHLSTLLIVALLAAGLVWLNVRETEILSSKDGVYLFPPKVRGWPMSLHRAISVSDVIEFSSASLAIDCLVCLALLAVAAAAIEWLTRRMKRGSPAENHGR